MLHGVFDIVVEHLPAQLEIKAGKPGQTVVSITFDDPGISTVEESDYKPHEAVNRAFRIAIDLARSWHEETKGLEDAPEWYFEPERKPVVRNFRQRQNRTDE